MLIRFSFPHVVYSENDVMGLFSLGIPDPNPIDARVKRSLKTSVGNLVAGSQYTFRVRSENDFHNKNESNSNWTLSEVETLGEQDTSQDIFLHSQNRCEFIMSMFIIYLLNFCFALTEIPMVKLEHIAYEYASYPSLAKLKVFWSTVKGKPTALKLQYRQV